MHKNFKIYAILFLSVSFSEVIAQRLQWIYGDFFNLIDEKEISITFNYDSMSVNEYKTAREFLDAMRRKHDKEVEGSGEIWEKRWFEQRTADFERRFKTLFYKYSGMVEDWESDNYTLIFKT